MAPPSPCLLLPANVLFFRAKRDRNPRPRCGTRREPSPLNRSRKDTRTRFETMIRRARAVRAVTAAIRAGAYWFALVEILWIETVLTFYPVLPMRAAVVASVGAALALFALASLSPAPPRASVAQMPPVRAPIAASVAYPRDSLVVLSRADSLNR